MAEPEILHTELPDIENVELVNRDNLLECIADMASRGFRFITTTCIDTGDRFEVYYHFDRDMRMSHLLVTIGKDESLPSISPIYFSAFIPENEMKDLFGLHVEGLNVDYRGRMLVSDELPSPPMRKPQTWREGDGG